MFRLCVAFLAICSALAAHEMSESKKLSSDGKIRVSLQQIHIDESGIFINVTGDWEPVGMLAQDSQGLYAIARPYIASPDLVFAWRCSECEHWNAGGSQSCRHCGAAR